MLGVDASQNLLRMSMTAMDECNERRAEAEECSILPFDRLVDVAARRGRGVLLVRHADRDAFPKAMPPAERDRQPLNAAGRARAHAGAAALRARAVRPARVLASPIARCVETAALVGADTWSRAGATLAAVAASAALAASPPDDGDGARAWAAHERARGGFAPTLAAWLDGELADVPSVAACAARPLAHLAGALPDDGVALAVAHDLTVLCVCEAARALRRGGRAEVDFCAGVFLSPEALAEFAEDAALCAAGACSCFG